MKQFLDSPYMKIVGWLIAVLVAYGALKTDVAVLDAKYNFIEKQIMEINENVRDINEHMRGW